MKIYINFIYYSYSLLNYFFFVLFFFNVCLCVFVCRVKPSLSSAHEAGTLTELDRDERKLEVFLGFHRSTLTAADLKIFLPFTINLDPYIKKVIKGHTHILHI